MGSTSTRGWDGLRLEVLLARPVPARAEGEAVVRAGEALAGEGATVWTGADGAAFDTDADGASVRSGRGRKATEGELSPAPDARCPGWRITLG